jgi:hypothetical protein
VSDAQCGGVLCCCEGRSLRVEKETYGGTSNHHHLEGCITSRSLHLPTGHHASLIGNPLALFSSFCLCIC